MNKEKVLIVSNMYPSKQYKSFGIFIKNQVEALKSKGFSIDIVAVKNASTGKVSALLKYSKWFLSAFLTLILKGKQYQVVHTHYVFPSGLIGLLFKKIFNTKLIVTAHGGDIDKMARKHKVIFNLTKKILHTSDTVIAVGEELKDTIISDFGIPSENIKVLNMGVNRDIFRKTDKQETKEHLKIKGDSTSILYVGNVIKQKGLEELITAFDKLVSNSDEKFKLFLIGSEKDTTFKQHLQDEILKRNLQGNVTFLGVLPQDEIANWMSACDIFVLPSHIEGFGLVALEAMSCGIPVVGTNVGGLKYLLKDDSGIIVEAHNSNSLYSGIKQIVENEELKENVINNGFRRARENDQENIINELEVLYSHTPIK
jgi:glycosyltransferase involved in cell wall biosynthesis